MDEIMMIMSTIQQTVTASVPRKIIPLMKKNELKVICSNQIVDLL